MEDSPTKKRRKATFREVGPSVSKDELIRRLKVRIFSSDIVKNFNLLTCYLTLP